MDPVERAQLKEQLMTAGKSTAAGRQVALKKLRGERCVNCSGAGKVRQPHETAVMFLGLVEALVEVQVDCCTQRPGRGVLLVV